MTTGGKVRTKACSSSLAERAQEAMKTTSAKEAGSSTFSMSSRKRL